MEILKSDYDRETQLWKFMPVEEERLFFDEVCTRIINNPRFYLDNLEQLSTFEVSWYRYTPYKELKDNAEPKGL